MTFPLGFWDISLLLAVVAIILLITSEVLSPYYGRINIHVNKRRLRNAALVASIAFLTTVAVRITNILTS